MKTRENQYKLVSSRHMHYEEGAGSRCEHTVSRFAASSYFVSYPQFGHPHRRLQYENWFS
jgi:hypothetical protein